MTRRKSRSLGAVFVLPVIIGMISMAGLLVGLLGDYPHDRLAALALAVPVAAMVWSLARRTC